MRTTLNIDDEALQAALELDPGRTKTHVINEALRRFVRTRRRRQLLQFQGKVEWDGDVDALRKRT